MPGRAAKVIITERQQEILQTMTRQRTCAQGLVLRADLILLAFEGLGAEEIAQRLGCERHSVGVWRRRWAKAFQRLVLVECCEGMGALRQAIEELLSDLPRSGCFGKFTPEQITLILAVACEPPEDSGRPVSHWTPRELADEVIGRGIVESISRRHVARFLKRPNCSPTAAATGSMRGQRIPKTFNSRSKPFAAAMERRRDCWPRGSIRYRPTR